MAHLWSLLAAVAGMPFLGLNMASSGLWSVRSHYQTMSWKHKQLVSHFHLDTYGSLQVQSLLQGRIPSLEMILPKYCTEGGRKWHLLILIVRPFSSALALICEGALSCNEHVINLTDYTWLFRKDLFHHSLENSW